MGQLLLYSAFVILDKVTSNPNSETKIPLAPTRVPSSVSRCLTPSRRPPSRGSFRDCQWVIQSLRSLTLHTQSSCPASISILCLIHPLLGHVCNMFLAQAEEERNLSVNLQSPLLHHHCLFGYSSCLVIMLLAQLMLRYKNKHTLFILKDISMLVDDLGDVTITDNGATILRMLEVEHPAAKVLVELAELQDREVGDGTTSVVIVAAELLKRANDLVRNKIHPTSIISGYRLAMREACKYIEEKLVTKVEKLGKVPLVNCAKTSMSSKLISGDSDFFANLVVDAVLSVKMTNQRGEIKYPIKGINILKAHGQSARDSYLLNGYALNTGRAAQGMPLRVSPAKIACLDFNLQKTKMQLGVQVVVNDPRELEKIRQREADMTKERIEKLLKAGANVILTTKGIDDMALKYFVEAGAIAVRRVRKEDMRHVAKATGATLVTTFADMEGEETFDPAHLGTADEVVEERIADDDVVLIKGTKTSSAVSLILRGANDYMLDEMERALHDALCIVKRTLESNTVVAGGGAVESALSVYLEHLATTLGSREQLAIAEFADALLIIPKVLAVNAAKDATELVAKLRAYHHTAQTKAEKKHYSSMGLDLVNGTIRNNLEAGVIEPAMSKVKIIQFATEAAITILRIDDMIKLVKDESQGDE